MNKQRMPVSREMIREFWDTKPGEDLYKFSEYDVDDDMVEAAIQDCADDADRAADAIESLASDAFAKENCLNLLHADPAVAQALVRRYFVRANADKIVAQIEDNFMRDREIDRIDAAEYAADAAAESAEARYARHAA